jgi:hypothetical protein
VSAQDVGLLAHLFLQPRPEERSVTREAMPTVIPRRVKAKRLLRRVMFRRTSVAGLISP